MVGEEMRAGGGGRGVELFLSMSCKHRIYTV